MDATPRDFLDKAIADYNKMFKTNIRYTDVYALEPNSIYLDVEDEEGKQYELKTTFSDSIGRKTDLSVAGSRGFRKSYEIVKPQTVGWAVYLMPIVCIVSLIYYPIKAKEKGLWEWEKQ